MKACVVDASVVAAAFFQEQHGDAAASLLAGKRELHAPDLILAEVANVIWKRCGRGEIGEDEACQMMADVLRLPLRITPCANLVDPALELAIRTRRTVYDCLYLALAVRTRSVMYTSDKRLANALADGPLDKHVAWIGALRRITGERDRHE
jgi:predicted nucleic acid-binding protein